MRECKGLGARLINFNNTACCLLPIIVVYIHIYGNMKHMDLCLQGSGDLHMRGSQTDQNITRILLFLDDLLIFYQAFGVNLSFNRCGMFVAGGTCMSIRYCASIRTYAVSHYRYTVSIFKNSTCDKLSEC